MKAGGLQPEKVTFLEERLHQPNPQEQEEWKAIEANSKAMERKKAKEAGEIPYDSVDEVFNRK